MFRLTSTPRHIMLFSIMVHNNMNICMLWLSLTYGMEKGKLPDSDSELKGKFSPFGHVPIVLFVGIVMAVKQRCH